MVALVGAVTTLTDPAGAQTVTTQVAAPPMGGPMAPQVTGTLTPWALLTATAGLIAFHIGLFTLVGRERKSPYIINAVYPIFLMCLVVAAMGLFAVLLPAWHQQLVLQGGVALLIVAFVFSALRVYRIAVRSVYFVDSLHPKHLPVIRHWRRWKPLKDRRRNYSHNTLPIPPDLKHEIIHILSDAGGKDFENRQELEPQALALAVQHQGQGNKLLAQLAEAFLKGGCSVQYLTASRHPIEFVGYVKRHLEGRSLIWPEYTKRIVVIDAYSPHFAFLDSIYPKKDLELESLDITRVESKMTYAGMHTASSKAFNVIKEQMADSARRPTLVIYEDTYALTDLESPEQYRIFVRHVMPSERMWDGMFTVFLESSMPDADWCMLQGYASMRLDLRACSAIADRISASSPDRAVPDQRGPDRPSPAQAINGTAKEPNP
ncbi:MAG: hypothetical protein WAS73_04080 [Defluviicoccus sp.]